MSVQIAIDGPSGAGKSTMAKMLSKELGFLYLDTGAMYRSFALYAIKKGVKIEGWSEDAPELIGLLDSFSLDIQYIDDVQHMIVNGEDYTGEIRTPEVSLGASKVSAVPAVRLKLVEIQREIASRQNVVMDGRDIGSYVLPNATLKIFLCASVEDRARRRYEELKLKGDNDSTYEEVLADMKLRDENDSKRSFAPLVCTEDAVRLDTTGNEIEETIAIIKNIVAERI